MLDWVMFPLLSPSLRIFFPAIPWRLLLWFRKIDKLFGQLLIAFHLLSIIIHPHCLMCRHFTSKNAQEEILKNLPRSNKSVPIVVIVLYNNII